MRGVNRPWSAVHDDVISEVKSLIAKYPDYTLESTGHSLGGALTYISYVALSQNFPDKEITSNALAAFPIGNEAWANFAGSLKGTLNRGNNAADGVPVSFLSFCVLLLSYQSLTSIRTCISPFHIVSSTTEP